MCRVSSSLDRFSDPLTPINYSGPPTNVPRLMRVLGVRGASFEAKKAAVNAWLEENEPLRVLREDLEDEGLI